jgi:RNA polymerase sigma factor for flagellar operon FliA
MDTATLWQTFQEDADPDAREALLTQNLRLVHHVARQLVRTSRVDVDFDDLISAGTIGLINAIDNFDVSRGLAFSTFAAPRIRGAILDDLRRRDHVPRSVRRKQRDLNRTRETLSGRLDRKPSDREMADELGVEMDKLWRWQREAEYAGRVSLDQPTERVSGQGATPAELLADPDTALDVEDRVNLLQEVEVLREELLNLKDQERLVLSLYYFEQLKLHEIASILGVTESRVSQIRTKALANLRARMGQLRGELCA